MLSLDLRLITDRDRIIAALAAFVARFRFITDRDRIFIPGLTLRTDGNTVFSQRGRFHADRDFIRVGILAVLIYKTACVRFPAERDVAF